MDHLMPVNEPFYQSQRSYKSDLTPKASYASKDTAGRAPGANDIYVGHIPNEVDSNVLAQFFSQFGEIERIFEGKKIPSGGMKWAFISYIHPEDSYRLLNQAGRIAIAGSILNIRPRDKTPALERERERQQRQPRHVNRDRQMSNNPNPMMKPPNHSNSNNNNRGQFGPGGFSPRSPADLMTNPTWTPYPLLSKTLTVANLPPEFTPKDLYALFCEFGNAEGAFVYAFPDAKGRRVGEVAMTSYLHAQKALEHMDGQYIEGYAVEVSYKPAIPLPPGQYSRSPELNVDYPAPMPMPICPPPSTLWNASSGGHPYMGPPIAPMPPPQPPPPSSYPMWPFPAARTPPVVDVVPRVHHGSPPSALPTPGPVPEPSPPPPYSAFPPIPETTHDTSLSHDDLATDSAAVGKSPCDPCNLFVKNLDDELIVTQRDLENIFAEYGSITSTFLATYPPKAPSTHAVSKGFGFVAFSRPQEAQLARDKMHGMIVGRKKIFVSFAEKKEDRQSRLKVLFENVEKMAEDLKNQLAIKEELRSEGMRDVRDVNAISKRGVFRGNQDGPIGSPVRLMPQSPSKQSSFQGQHSRYIPRGSPVRGKGPFRRQKGRNPSFRKSQPSSSDQTFVDLDFHEDFPPLPKSVKPAQSPTLQKLAHAATLSKDQAVDNYAETDFTPSLIESLLVISRPQTSGDIPDTAIPVTTPVRNDAMDVDHEFASHRSSVQGTPATFPRAPPPSSAEMSTAGNTAPSTPTMPYVRPRITLQYLQDRLRAHAIVTLQEEGVLIVSQSAPVSPLLQPIIPLGDLRKTVIVGEANEMAEVMERLDTTVGAGTSVSSDPGFAAEWIGGSSFIKT